MIDWRLNMQLSLVLKGKPREINRVLARLRNYSSATGVESQIDGSVKVTLKGGEVTTIR